MKFNSLEKYHQE